MSEASSQVITHDPSKNYANSEYFPTGYSLQTGTVVSGWRDQEEQIKRKAEARGEGVTFQRDGDFSKLKGTRYKFCCESVQVKYSQCDHCGNPIY